MTAPGGVIATVYVQVLPTVRDFSRQLRQQLRASSRQLRTIDRELEPVSQSLARIGRVATGIVPGIRLTTQSLLTLGGHAVVGGMLSAAGAAATLSGALVTVPALGVAAASVVGALAVGLFDLSKTFKAFVKGPEEFAENIGKLSANAQATLGVFETLRGEITGFRNSVQDRLFAGMEDVVRGLADTFLPRLQSHFGNLVDTINLGAKDLAAFAQSGQTLADVDEVAFNTETAFSMLRQALVPAGTALRDVVTVGSRFLPLIALEVTRIVQRFSEWIQVMRATGQLQEFINSGLQTLRQLGQIVANLGRAVAALLGAARESGNGLLSTLEALTGKVADFLESGRGQNAIKDFLDTTRGAAEALTPVVVALADLFFNHVFPIFERFAKAVGPAVAEFFLGLGSALDVAAPGIVEFARGFGAFISAIVPALPTVGQLIGQIGQLVSILAIRLGPIIADIVVTISNLLIPVLNILTAIFTLLPTPILKLIVVFGVVTVALGAFVSIIRNVLIVTKLFAGGLELLSGTLLKTQKGVGGIVGFLSGPWGIALGIATVALGLFLSTTEKTTQQQDQFRSVASDLNDVLREQNGVINDNVRLKAAEQLESAGALRFARELGISLQDVNDAYVQQGDALEDLRARLQRIIDANRVEMTTDDPLGLNDQGEAALKLKLLLEQLSGARDADAEATRREAEAANQARTPMEAWRVVIEGTTFAINSLLDAQMRQQQQQLSAINSELAYFNQLERTRVELTEGTLTLDKYSQEGRDNLGVITQLVQAGLTRIQDLQKQNASTEQVAAATEAMQNDLLNLVQPFFANRDAARTFLQQLGLFPDTITITIITNLNQVAAAAAAAGRAIAGLASFGAGTRARGGPVRAGEWTLVGEKGPELVRWGRSARVFSNGESERMATDVGELDTMTRNGTTGYDATRTGMMTSTQPTTIDNRLTVEPNVRVFIDGQELRGMVRVELDQRDRQMQRLVTSHAGTRGSRG